MESFVLWSLKVWPARGLNKKLWAFFNSRTRPRVNHVLRNQLACDVINLVAYRLRKLQRATRAVHNRAAACVAAGGGIFENQL